MKTLQTVKSIAEDIRETSVHMHMAVTEEDFEALEKAAATLDTFMGAYDACKAELSGIYASPSEADASVIAEINGILADTRRIYDEAMRMMAQAADSTRLEIKHINTRKRTVDYGQNEYVAPLYIDKNS